METSKTFRPTLGYWINRDGLPIIVLGPLILIIALFAQGKSLRPLIGVSVLSALVAVISIPNTIKLMRTQIIIDADGIKGRIGRETMNVLWRAVLATEFKQHPIHPKINLYTGQNRFSIPVEYFQIRELWDECKKHLSPEALTEAGLKKVDGYAEWMNTLHQLVQDQTISLKARLGSMRIIGMIGVVFFIGIGVLSFLSKSATGTFMSLACFGPFALGSLYLLGASGTIKLNYQQVEYSSWLGTYAMKWDEMTQVERDLGEAMFVFSNAQKQLPIMGIGYWSGSDRAAMSEYMDAQIMVRKIAVKYSQKALFRLPKNTRVANPK